MMRILIRLFALVIVFNANNPDGNNPAIRIINDDNEFVLMLILCGHVCIVLERSVVIWEIHFQMKEPFLVSKINFG